MPKRLWLVAELMPKAYRLKNEYGVDCIYESINTALARWIACDDEKRFVAFKQEQSRHLALDGAGNLTYLAPSRVSFDITKEQWPEVEFRDTREH